MFHLVRGSVYLIIVLGAFFSFLYTGLVTIFTYIVLILNIYIYMMYVFFTYLYIYNDICMQSLFLFHTWCLSEFCLSVSERQVVKVYHTVNSLLCKVYQKFVIGIDLFCNTTSGYELSNLGLLSWLVVLLWFCHELPKMEIVKDIFYVIH